MSLTLRSALRSAKDDDSIAGSVADVPAVTQFGPEVTQAIADMLFGPTQYQGVCMLNRAADYMSDRCMAAATRNAEDFEHYFDAALFLRKHAEKLDQALVDESVEAFKAEQVRRGIANMTTPDTDYVRCESCGGQFCWLTARSNHYTRFCSRKCEEFANEMRQA